MTHYQTSLDCIALMSFGGIYSEKVSNHFLEIGLENGLGEIQRLINEGLSSYIVLQTLKSLVSSLKRGTQTVSGTLSSKTEYFIFLDY